MFGTQGSDTLPDGLALQSPEREFLRIPLFGEILRRSIGFRYPPFTEEARGKMICDPDKPTAGLPRLGPQRQRLEGRGEDISGEFLRVLWVSCPPKEIVKYPRIVEVVNSCKLLRVHQYRTQMDSTYRCGADRVSLRAIVRLILRFHSCE